MYSYVQCICFSYQVFVLSHPLDCRYASDTATELKMQERSCPILYILALFCNTDACVCSRHNLLSMDTDCNTGKHQRRLPDPPWRRTSKCSLPALMDAITSAKLASSYHQSNLSLGSNSIRKVLCRIKPRKEPADINAIQES